MTTEQSQPWCDACLADEERGHCGGFTAGCGCPCGVSHFGLVMPFIVCQSQDGPYEDQAFVAGYALGQIDAVVRLAVAGTPELGFSHPFTVRTASLPQLDLIAMRHGCTVDREDGDDEWTLVHVVREEAG